MITAASPRHCYRIEAVTVYYVYAPTAQEARAKFEIDDGVVRSVRPSIIAHVKKVR